MTVEIVKMYWDVSDIQEVKTDLLVWGHINKELKYKSDCIFKIGWILLIKIKNVKEGNIVRQQHNYQIT